MLDEHVLASCDALNNGGSALYFHVYKDGQIYPAFAIRHEGKVRAFLNVCPHMGLRLNRDTTALFHDTGGYLFCRPHGAGFDPLTGLCILGPCPGQRLIALDVRERGDDIVFEDGNYDLHIADV